MQFIACCEVRVFNLPIGYFGAVLRVVFRNEFLVGVTHNYDFVCPLQQLFGNTLRAVVARVVA